MTDLIEFVVLVVYANWSIRDTLSGNAQSDNKRRGSDPLQQCSVRIPNHRGRLPQCQYFMHHPIVPAAMNEERAPLERLCERVGAFRTRSFVGEDFENVEREVDGLEPHREGQLGGVEDGACGNRGLALAAIALLELAAAQLAASVMDTVRAQKPIGPSPLIQGVEALVFGAVEREEFVEADSFLEPYRVAGHGNLLFYHVITWRYSILSAA